VGWPDTTASIPGGWTRVTTLDAKHPKQIPSSSTDPGTAVGATTHTHTAASHTHTVSHTHASGTTATGSGTATAAAGGTLDTQTTEAHTHTTGTVTASTDATNAVAPTSDTGANDPARWDTIWIASDGSPTTIPAGAIGHWNTTTLPSGWSQPANSQERFLRGAAAAGNGGGTGGGASHTHAGGSHHHASSHGHPSGTTGVGANVNTSQLAGTVLALDTHVHSYDAVTGNFGDSTDGALSTSATATPDPPWMKLPVIASPGEAPPIGFIGLWLNLLSLIPVGWHLADGLDGTLSLCQGKFVRGCTLLSELGTTGGASTHSHTGASHTHTWTSTAHTHVLTVNATTDFVGTTGATQTGSSPGHAHATTTSGAASAVTVGTATPNLAASGHDPAAVEVAYIQYMGEPVSGDRYVAVLR
jgi:hypothetical protein